jgi:hypothetical protein
MSQALATGRELIARTVRVPEIAALDGVAVGAGSCVLVGGVSAAAGGYFPTSWGWTALALFWVAAISLLVRSSVEVGPFELVFVGALTLFAAWVWLSTTWSSTAPSSFLEGQRVLVYVAAASVAVLLARRRSVPQLVGGVLAGITLISTYGLATRLFPNRIGSFDPIAGYRLEEPVGYWNALGILAAIGALLALGLAARALAPWRRALAGASLAILLPTLYFTYSRGSWVALGVGVLIAIIYESRRLQLLTAFALVAVAPALTVLLASRSDALTHKTASVAAATHDGHRLALVVLGAGAASAALTLALAAAERRLVVPRSVHVAYAGVLLALAAAAIAVGVARYGSPSTIARDAYDRFTAKPADASANLNERLFNFSGNGRGQLWKAAWQDYEDHPWLGSGAGSYEQEWYLRRTLDLDVRDAHNLYVEQLAEVGPVGLGLLALALALPLGAAARARRARLTGTALGAYVAFLLHAAVDWDWEVTAVTLAGLLCGIAVLVSARGDREPRSLRPMLRFGAVGVTAALAALAFVGLVGNLALATSHHAAARGDWSKAVAEARRASDWAPWSSQALRQLGEAELRRGNDAAAAASFRRAIAKDPRDWQLQLDLYRSTSGAEAREAFRKTYELNPRGVSG